MKIFTGRKCAAMMAMPFYITAFAAVLCCGCLFEIDGLAVAFLEKRTFTVSFDANGGNPANISPCRVIQGEEGWFPDNPVKSGHRFDGWFDGMTEYTPSTAITKNVTLTAKWTAIVYGSLTDERDGKTYKSVEIGSQTWMAENLNYAVDSSWCYGNDASNCETYGRLYTWEAAKSACASLGGGWRLPDTVDWNKLVSYAGGSSVAGKKLKSQSGWNDYNSARSGNGTDDYGFSALPGGNRGSGVFYNVGYHGSWWSATEGDGGSAYGRGMDDYNDLVGEGNYGKSGGFSVRCVGAAQ